MTILILEQADTRTRGILCNFLYHVGKNVYIGNINSRIREALVNQVLVANNVDAYLIYPFSNPQGFNVDVIGNARYDQLSGMFVARHIK